MNGKEVKRFTYVVDGKYDVSDLATGAYLVKIQNGSTNKVVKFVKK